MKKKIVSLFLALVLCLGLAIPVSADTATFQATAPLGSTTSWTVKDPDSGQTWSGTAQNVAVNSTVNFSTNSISEVVLKYCVKKADGRWECLPVTNIIPTGSFTISTKVPGIGNNYDHILILVCPNSDGVPLASFYSTISMDYVAGFTDVLKTSPFADAIRWAVEIGITKGTTPTTFGTNNTCTLSHILTFLWRIADQPGDSVAAWATNLGIDASDLNIPCTRAMAIECIWKASGRPASSKDANFTDIPADADYAKAIAWAVEYGITSGTSSTTFSPDNICTRGQIITFIYRHQNQ